MTQYLARVQLEEGANYETLYTHLIADGWLKTVGPVGAKFKLPTGTYVKTSADSLDTVTTGLKDAAERAFEDAQAIVVIVSDGMFFGLDRAERSKLAKLLLG